MGINGGLLHPDIDRGRTGKLLAGIRYSLHLSGPAKQADCTTCESREKRNCRNRKHLQHEILTGPDEWRQVTSGLRHVLKVNRTKFFACPLTAITDKTWKILGIVNDTTNAEGEITYQHEHIDSPWYRDAVRLVKSERARHRAEQMDKTHGKQ